MKDLWNYLKNSKKPIVLYGIGNGADKIISVLERYGIKVSGVFASDGFVRKKTFHGFEVTDYAAAKKAFGDMTVLLCFGTALPDVIENIKRISATDELYAPDVPVYGDLLFNGEYACLHRNELEWVYGRLADDLSKKTFHNAIMYKLTGKIEYLFDCETNAESVYSEILKLNDGETYFDLGAYRGDTVKEFVLNVNGYNQICAVEPDNKTYKKLCFETENLKNIETLNVCIGDCDGKKVFCMDGSRGSTVSQNGTVIDSVTVDTLSKKYAPTYIKMDIEGSETDALKGACRTVFEHKPKMQIAAYHRSEDLTVIPETVLRLRDDYKVYLRHFPCLPCWDMSYYFV